MVRLLLVDDSPSVRQILSQRLTERGYEVLPATDAVMAAELAFAAPPDYVVTDLWMPGISGVQLCRLLKAEPRTAHVPVVLITGESQRRSRFWARTAGAVGYVAKDDPTALFKLLERLLVDSPPRPPESDRPASRTPIQHRLFERLDEALFESVVAGEVRALAHQEGDAESVFRGLNALASEVVTYRWLALHVRSPAKLFVHVDPAERLAAEAEARLALGVGSDVEVTVIADERAVSGRAVAPLVSEIQAGGKVVGAVALGPGARGASRDDRELMSIFTAELGGPLRIVALVEQTRHLAMTDPLTGLLNRRAFIELMSRSIGAFERYGHPISLMLLDVDHFKRVNDEHGHDGGDAVLVKIAELLRGVARRTDYVGRWGGEELVVGLAQTSIPVAAIPAERARRLIFDNPVRLPNGKDVRVSVSIGVATLLPGEPIDQFIARADHAMYLAKSRGRNRTVLHDGAPTAPEASADSTLPPPKLAAV